MREQLPQEVGCGFVFSGDDGKTHVATGKVKAALDLVLRFKTRWRPHDIRRIVATGMERMGVPIGVTEAILGHVSGSKSGVVGIYQRHSYDREKREAVERWADHVRNLVFT